MEQARYWTWAKRNPDLNPRHTLPPLPPAAMDSCGDSWEEQAFAEDAAGILGGCVWPPRFYSCSFCRREFRSAQALGGHMNVHRRDRARLKQSPAPQTEVAAQNHSLNPRTSFNAPYSPNMCAFLYNNPNPEFSDTRPLVSPLSHVIRVSSPPATNASVEEKTSTLCLLSPLDLKRERDSSDSSQPPPWSSFVTDKRDRVLDSINYRRSNVIPSDSQTEREDCVSEDLSTSLHLVVCRRQTNASSDEEVGSCKRRRIEAKPSSFFPKLSAVDRCLPEPEVLKLRSGSSEEVLDLELRL